MIARKKI